MVGVVVGRVVGAGTVVAGDVGRGVIAGTEVVGAGLVGRGGRRRVHAARERGRRFSM
ncbi:hypothetical membrane protein [Glutamicibacter arilaitensis Re117]|uniref:Hypothetical membrane protein n=1 Tax=Glutamicibacter arilaitensis (strain DSM 16368 / CIP 108037 / IAM 15318 / JCM 13566 / NCIMB 14258 / Re117) TaxID=861360 RepID=A0ABM9Q0I7_GLUAR|nr:hypothetical membrane protein [Glutamicibacter arilaitensis Re117]